MYYNALTQVEIGKKNFDVARNYLNKEIDILNEFNCPDRISRHYKNYSLLYQFLNKHDSAVYVALKGLDFAEIAKDTLTQILLCANIGAFFDQLKQYDKAIYYEKKGLELARKTDNSYYLSALLIQSANSYLTLFENTKNEKYLDSLIVFAEEGLSAALKSRTLPYVLDAYGVISQYYFNKKDFKKALNYADSV
jgi:tetratricopeptide (TPR) repeat protein